MGFLKLANIKKTIYYFKRNGIKNTFLAVLERCTTKKEAYTYANLSEDVYEEQKNYLFSFPCKFSILVPAYETKEVFLRELIESVLNQTYRNFELVIADASKTNCVEKVVSSYTDERIVYKKLENNGGISENTNAGLAETTGDYVGLLDHDDILTKDALFEMARAIEKGKKEGKEPWLLYSDEDKCDSSGTNFFEPHRKLDFNLDLLLSNNYICHFLVMKANFMKRLRFRKEYDGAQDYDIILRGVGTLMREKGYEKTRNEMVCHIPKVLYHWRCHEASTAENPESKQYAYEAGKKAIKNFLLNEDCYSSAVVDTCHLGFYHVLSTDKFEGPGAIGAFGGNVINRRKIICGGMERDGITPFKGKKVYFSGYMHRVALRQTVDVLDLRCIEVNPKLMKLFEEVTGMEYDRDLKTDMFCRENYKKTEAEWIDLSHKFSQKVREAGYRLVYNPDYVYKKKKYLSVTRKDGAV